MCSFEVHHVDVAQKFEIGRGTLKLQLQLMSPPSTFLIFELHQHDVPQKNTFFKENSDSEEKSIFL